MIIMRSEIRRFFEEKLREELFRGSTFTRSDICSMYRYFTGKAYLSLDERVALINAVVNYLNNDGDYKYVTDITFEDDTRGLCFFLDPVNVKQWEDAMDSIYVYRTDSDEVEE